MKCVTTSSFTGLKLSSLEKNKRGRNLRMLEEYLYIVPLKDGVQKCYLNSLKILGPLSQTLVEGRQKRGEFY